MKELGMNNIASGGCSKDGRRGHPFWKGELKGDSDERTYGTSHCQKSLVKAFVEIGRTLKSMLYPFRIRMPERNNIGMDKGISR